MIITDGYWDENDDSVKFNAVVKLRSTAYKTN